MSEFSSKQLRRTQRGRIIAGVCSGVGEYVGIDANIIRVGLAIATLFGGAGIAVYAIGWLLLPEEGKDASIVQDLMNKQQSQSQSPWQGNTDEHKPQQ
ncbi:PspC domain-containing protein [Nonomuraea sp. NPDC050556]|uniref:PspC domain-containing protein n=1 Tax=Nonomuraea sp. NPDC050556 TaxID=3364369 RepID=UPI003793D173